MIVVTRRRLRWWLGIVFSLLVSVCALAIGYYLEQGRRHVGADYTAMVTDVVRAQDDVVKLRLTLDNLRENPEVLHVRQLDTLLMRIAQRAQTIRQLVRQSDLPRRDYTPLLGEIELAERQLAELIREVESTRGREPDEVDIARLTRLGMAVEESLAWTYSELNELVHSASAEQRRMMQRLSMAVTGLLMLVVLVVGVLMLALLRIHQQREALRHQSQTDALTGLYNRRKIYEVAEQELARIHRTGSSLGLVLIDLDHFKRINDTYGHPVGDAVLKAFARLLTDEVREMDFAVRMSGEEFAILMPDSDCASAYRLAERIRKATASLTLPGKARDATLTASFGVTAAGDEVDHFDQLFSRADKLLYLAKTSGRNRTEAG